MARLGRHFGSDLLAVQAAGGNISVKTSSRRIAIKASGVRLRDMTSASGWAAADRLLIQARLQKIAALTSFRRRESAYAKLLRKASRTAGRRISMETGFHAVLPEQYVLHLHSVAGILVGMMPPGQARFMITRACGERVRVCFAPASLPGFDLTCRMMQSTRRAPDDRIHLWIQRNHGVAWSGNDKEAVLAMVQRFERFLRTSFQLHRYPVPHEFGSAACRSRFGERCVLTAMPYAISRAVCFCRWPKWYFSLEPLFHDFVIYFNLRGRSGPDLAQAGPRGAVISARTPVQWRDKKEVLYAHALVSTIAQARGWRKPLPRRMIRRLNAMETERLRKVQILRS